MDKKNYNPPEIVKLKDERGTISVRLPRWFVDLHKLKRSDYLVFTDTLKGDMKVQAWDGFVNEKGKFKARKAGRDKTR